MEPDSNRTIGDVVIFTVRLELPDDVHELQIKDLLPAGLNYLKWDGDIPAPTRPDSGTLLWNLGDGGKKEIVFRVHAVVRNIMTNQDGTVLLNRVEATWKDSRGALFSTNTTTPVTIREPDIKITISSNKTKVQAGDIVEQVVMLSNRGCDAYDVHLIVTIADGLEVLSADLEHDVNGGSVEWTCYRIPSKTSENLRLVLRVGNTVVSGESLSTGASVSWTSLPGEDPNERWGGGTPLNNYDETASAKLTVSGDVSISKTPDTNRSCAIGDSVTYKIHLNLPRAVLREVVVTDTLPSGTTCDPSSLKTSGFVPNDIQPPSPDSNTLVLSFGDLNNADDVDMDIWYTVIVANRRENRNGVILTPGAARITWKNPDGSSRQRTDSKAGSIEVVEPSLSLEKHASSYAIVGDEVRFTLSIYHDGNSRSDAYDLILVDTIPEGARILGINTSRPMGFEQMGRDLVWSIQRLERGESVTVTYTILAETTGSVGGAARLYWSSREGDDPNERSGLWNDLDCYNKTAEAYVAVENLSMRCEPDGPVRRSFGEDLMIRFYGDLPNLRDAWMNLSLRGLKHSDIRMSFNPLEEIVRSDRICWYLGDVQAMHVDLSVHAIIDDLAPGAVLELSWLSNDARRSISVATGPVEISKPELTVTKTPARRSLERGSMLRCSVRIDHSPESKCDAWNVVLREIIPQGVRMMPESVRISPERGDLEMGDGSLLWRIGRLGPGESASLEYDIVALSDGRSISESALTWSSAESGGRNYTASASSEFIVGSSYLSVDAPENACGFVNYTVRWRNIGERDIRGAVLKARYDPLLVFISSSPMPCAPDGGIWSGCALPDVIHPGDEGTIRIVTRAGRAANGTAVETLFTISFEGHDENVSARTVLIAPEISLSATGSPERVRSGEAVSYTVSYRNRGAAKATNVTLRALFPSSVHIISAIPMPIASGEDLVWSESSGLMPGEERVIRITALVEGDGVTKATFILESSESPPVSADVHTYVHLPRKEISVTKRPSCTECMRGETVEYEIRVCNPSDADLRDITVKEIPDPRFVIQNADPAPGPDGLWHINHLRAGECAVIRISGILPRSEMYFDMAGRVEGQGFIRTYRECTSGFEGTALRNCVQAFSGNISAGDCVTVRIEAENGAELHMRGYGSGSLRSQEGMSMSTENRSIRISRSQAAEGGRYEGEVYRRSVAFDSPWSDLFEISNRATHGGVRAFARAEREISSIDAAADSNGTVVSIERDLTGSGGILAEKISNTTGVLRAYDHNSGSSNVSVRFEEHGEYGSYVHSHLGNGTLVSGRSYGALQFHTSGSGRYLSEGMMSCGSIKEIVRADGNSSRWRSGAWIRGVQSIREEYSGSRIEKDTVLRARGLETSVNFSGMAFTDTHFMDSHLSDIYIGNYTVRRSISLPDSYRYGTPHISISTDMYMERSEIIRLTVKIHNDGIRDLSPVYITAAIPNGSRVLGAYPEPDIRNDLIRWRLYVLEAGESLAITLRLDLRDALSREIFVRAAGGFDGHWVYAMNRTAPVRCCSN
ncbi:MAG: hypothetical protein QHG98_07955 [Methanothrix sp.]|uniref:hypothetical protein n=1 Tax=Methanothrix sp. TaxID=90426 RepID=UPI00247E4784|nr:hypothetical protein [Methanothrix sp.]